MFWKTNFLSISELLSKRVFFLLKREVFSDFTRKCFITTGKQFSICPILVVWSKTVVFNELARKCFKTTGKHNLAVCGSFCGEKQFLLIIVPFYCFEQKQLFTPNPNFPLAFLLFKLDEKSNLFEYFWASFWDSHFLNKKRSFQWIFPKILKKKKKAKFSCMWLILLENFFLLIFSSFYCFIQKGLFTTNPNFPLDLPLLKFVKKNKLSECFSAPFWESHFFDWKEKLSVNLTEKVSKQEESLV